MSFGLLHRTIGYAPAAPHICHDLEKRRIQAGHRALHLLGGLGCRHFRLESSEPGFCDRQRLVGLGQGGLRYGCGLHSMLSSGTAACHKLLSFVYLLADRPCTENGFLLLRDLGFQGSSGGRIFFVVGNARQRRFQRRDLFGGGLPDGSDVAAIRLCGGRLWHHRSLQVARDFCQLRADTVAVGVVVVVVVAGRRDAGVLLSRILVALLDTAGAASLRLRPVVLPIEIVAMAAFPLRPFVLRSTRRIAR